MGLQLTQLEPGMVLRTPEVFSSLGWDKEGMVFAGGDPLYPSFILSKGGTLGSGQWPTGALGVIAPMPDFEPVENSKLQELRKMQIQKGTFTGIGYKAGSGCDPEFFVVNGKDEVIPARSFLPDKTRRTGMFFDGLQAEIAPSGQSCLEVLSTGIHTLLEQAFNSAQRVDKTARFTLRNSFKFTPEQMAAFSDEDVRFRCSTSLNVYDDTGELPEAREYLWRFAGGHIHIGCGKRTPGVIRSMVRALDGLVGVAGVSLARNWDTPERRRMYGRAGEFRLPKHGLEYRVLSNFWLSSPLIYHLVFELARMAYRLGECGAFDAVYDGTEEEVRHCINHCDVGLAVKLIERNSKFYENIFKKIWGNSSRCRERAMSTILKGLETAVSNPEDIRRNWMPHSGSYPSTWGRIFA